MNADEQRAYDTLQARNDALARSIVDLYERIERDEKLLVAYKHTFKDLYARVDRLDEELFDDDGRPTLDVETDLA
jgi:hypothetical protein